METHHTSCPECHTDLRDEAVQDLQYCPNCRFPTVILKGEFCLEKKINSGGFGVIYQATQLSTSKPCVVKVIHPDLYYDTKIVTRFKREIRVTQQVSQDSEHIVDVIEHHDDPDVGLFYVMEYLSGESLQDLLIQKIPFTMQEIFSTIEQICEALQAAHNHSVIHRDLKPGNIFLTRQSDSSIFVKLLDFSLAKPLQETLNVGLTTNSLGTPLYMSPKQCLNNDISPASDRYSLGIILFELLTGESPFVDKKTDCNYVKAYQRTSRLPPLTTSRYTLPYQPCSCPFRWPFAP